MMLSKLFIVALVYSLVGVTPRPESVQLPDNGPVLTSVGKIRYVRDASLAPEAYEIRIRRRHVVVRSSDDAGRFYALKTLGQLERSGALRPGTVKDGPRYPWRGFLLDEARHFHGRRK